jgi:hypothetical protein
VEVEASSNAALRQAGLLGRWPGAACSKPPLNRILKQYGRSDHFSRRQIRQPARQAAPRLAPENFGRGRKIVSRPWLHRTSLRDIGKLAGMKAGKRAKGIENVGRSLLDDVAAEGVLTPGVDRSAARLAFLGALNWS